MNQNQDNVIQSTEISANLYDVKVVDSAGAAIDYQVKASQIIGLESGQIVKAKIRTNGNMFQGIEFKIGMPPELISAGNVELKSGDLFDGLEFINDSKLYTDHAKCVLALKNKPTPGTWVDGEFVAIAFKYLNGKIEIWIEVE